MPEPQTKAQTAEMGFDSLYKLVAFHLRYSSYRMRVRGPSSVNLQSLPKMAEGRPLADVIAAIGSIHIVLGEVDR